LRPGERGDGRKGGVDPLARDPDLRDRLALDRLLPHPALVQLGEEVVEAPHRELGEARVNTVVAPFGALAILVCLAINASDWMLRTERRKEHQHA